MKVKLLLLISLISMQSIYGSDVISLLQEADRLADDLVKVVGFASEKSKSSPEIVPVIDPDKVTRYPNIQIPKDTLSVEIPDGGESLHIHEYNLLYPVATASKPAHIQHSHAHFGHNLIELPVLQQNRGVWEGGSIDMGAFGGRNVSYTMAQLQSADGLNCGYHALKNVMYMLAACKNLELGSTDDAQNLLYKMQDIPSFTQLLTPWLQFVIPYRYENNKDAYNTYPRGNFPVGTDLEKIVGEDGNQPLLPQSLEGLFSDGLHTHILIVDSFSYLTDSKVASDKYLDFLKNVVNKNEVYGFVVNSAADQNLSSARGSHWFGYVLWKHADGTSTWLYTDSLFSSRVPITNELLRICSQTPVEFTDFLAKRDCVIIEEPLKRVESKLERLHNSVDAYAFKFACHKIGKLRDCVFVIDDFKKYGTLVNDALVATCNQLLQSKLKTLSFVSLREVEWQFSFWQKDKDSSWKVTYLDKKKIYDNHVYFELLDGTEDITILADIPGQIFAELLREPIGTTKWNKAIVDRVIKVLNSTLDYMIANKKNFASQFELLDDKDRIFAKIKKDVGDNAPEVDMAAIEAKFSQLFS